MGNQQVFGWERLRGEGELLFHVPLVRTCSSLGREEGDCAGKRCSSAGAKDMSSQSDGGGLCGRGRGTG